MLCVNPEIDFVAFTAESEMNRDGLNPFHFFVSTYCVLFHADRPAVQQVRWRPIPVTHFAGRSRREIKSRVNLQVKRAIGQIFYCSGYDCLAVSVPLSLLRSDYTPNVVVDLMFLLYRYLGGEPNSAASDQETGINAETNTTSTRSRHNLSTITEKACVSGRVVA